MTQSSTPDQPEPPRLRFLRWLVIVLTTTMILGLITIVSVIVMTFMRTNEPGTSPAQISIPDGERSLAFTKGTDWNAVVTRDAAGIERIHILNPDTGEIKQTIEVQTAR